MTAVLPSPRFSRWIGLLYHCCRELFSSPRAIPITWYFGVWILSPGTPLEMRLGQFWVSNWRVLLWKPGNPGIAVGVFPAETGKETTDSITAKRKTIYPICHISPVFNSSEAQKIMGTYIVLILFSFLVEGKTSIYLWRLFLTRYVLRDKKITFSTLSNNILLILAFIQHYFRHCYNTWIQCIQFCLYKSTSWVEVVLFL